MTEKKLRLMSHHAIQFRVDRYSGLIDHRGVEGYADIRIKLAKKTRDSHNPAYPNLKTPEGRAQMRSAIIASVQAVISDRYVETPDLVQGRPATVHPDLLCQACGNLEENDVCRRLRIQREIKLSAPRRN